MPRRIGPGGLDERVTLERVTRSADGAGGFEEGWATVSDLWARVEPVRGQERVIADRQAGVQTYLITVRNAGVGATIAVADRLIWRGEALNVRATPAAGRDLYRRIEAESGVVT